MSWDNLNTQITVQKTLQKLLQSQRIPHALLFLGKGGQDKLSACRELAKSLLCPNRKGVYACEDCSVCQRVNHDGHPDVSFVRPDEGSAVIKVEAIREMIKFSSYKPVEAPYKIFIFEEAQRMNETSQNALLKTLEEPEGNTLFVLLSESTEGLLETIRSRCQNLYFTPGKSQALNDEEVLRLGRQSVEYLLYEASAQPTRYLEPPDLGRQDRETVKAVFDHLTAYFRDVLVLALGAQELVLSLDDLVEKKKIAKQMPVQAILDRMEFLSCMKAKIQDHVNIRLAMNYFWETIRSKEESLALAEDGLS